MARVWEVPAFNRYELLSVTFGVTAVVVHGSNRVANLHSKLGHYYVANANGDGIRVRRADGYTPRTVFGGSGGFESDVMATGSATDANPALLEDYRHFIVLFYENAGNVYRVESGDRGVTWSVPVSQLPGILPAVTVGAVHKQEVAVAVQGDNSLLGTVKYPGDRWPNDNYTGSSEGTSSDAPYMLLDDAGLPLATDGTGVALSNPADGRIVMAMKVDGESDLSHWWSGDKTASTWTRVT
jgi:hypothetical protein